MSIQIHGIGASLSAATVALAAFTALPAQAQDNVVKVGVTRYDTHSSTSGLAITSTLPPGSLDGLSGSDARTGDATTVIGVYERTLTPNIGVEIVLGVPPRIDAQAIGPVATLLATAGVSNEILSARNVSPTLLFNYYFGAPGDTWRPYLGAGINYTRFNSIRSSLPTTRLSMSDSWGLALQAGISYSMSRDWGLFASVARLDVDSDVEAVASVPGVPVPVTVNTTVDFKPRTYSAGAWFRF